MTASSVVLHATEPPPVEGTAISVFGSIVDDPEEIPEAKFHGPFSQAKGLSVTGIAWRGGLELEARRDDFGGWSGLALSRDGTRLLAVSDIGRWMTATLNRDANGTLAGIGSVQFGRLPGTEGAPIQGKLAADAETLATPAPDTEGLDWPRIIVGFERDHRLWRYAASAGRPFGAKAFPIPAPRGTAAIPRNSGLEALTVLADGRLFALTEHYRPEHPDHLRGWIGGRNLWEPGAAAGWRDWKAFSYAMADGFRPTGATLLPDGDVLVVERYYSPLTGVRARLVRVRTADLRPDALVETEQLARIVRPYPVDNMEGIAVHLAPNGETIVTLLSDDNFNRSLQRTLLMSFALTD